MTQIGKYSLVDKAYNVCLAIEECGASEKLTHAVTLASELMRELETFYEEQIETCNKIIVYTQDRLRKVNEGINPLTGQPYKIQEFCIETMMVSTMKDKLESIKLRSVTQKELEELRGEPITLIPTAARSNKKNEDESFRADLQVKQLLADDSFKKVFTDLIISNYKLGVTEYARNPSYNDTHYHWKAEHDLMYYLMDNAPEFWQELSKKILEEDSKQSV